MKSTRMKVNCRKGKKRSKENPMEETSASREQIAEDNVDNIVLQTGHGALMDMMKHSPSDVLLHVDGDCYHANWRYLESRSGYFAANRSFLNAYSTASNAIKVLPPAPALFKDALWFIYTQELNNESKAPENFVGNLKNATYLGIASFTEALQELFVHKHGAILSSPDFNWENIPITDLGNLLSRVPASSIFALVVPWAKGLPDDLALEVRAWLPVWNPYYAPSGLTLQNIATWLAKDAETAGKVLTVESTFKSVEKLLSTALRTCSNCHTSFYLPNSCCRCNDKNAARVMLSPSDYLPC